MSLQLWRVYVGRGHGTKGQGGGLGGKRGGEAILPRALCVCKISATGLLEKLSFLVHTNNLKRDRNDYFRSQMLVFLLNYEIWL